MKIVMAVTVAVLFLTVLPMAHAQLSGDWEGTTDQGYPLHFTVVDNIITGINLAFNLECWDHKSTSVGLGFGGPPVAPDGSFSFKYTGLNFSFHIEGTFDSSVTARGSAGSNWAALWLIKQTEAVQKCLSKNRAWTASLVPPSAAQGQDISESSYDYDYFMEVTNGPDGESFTFRSRGIQGN